MSVNSQRDFTYILMFRWVSILIVCVSLSVAACRQDSTAAIGNISKPKQAYAEARNELLWRTDGTFDAARVGGETIVAVGRMGEILRSETDGNTWSRVNSRTSEPLLSVAFSDDEHGVVVGANGCYLESADAGKSWRLRSVGVHDNLFTVRFFDHKTGFILGAFGTLLQSDDAGKNWRVVDLNWGKFLPELSEKLGLVQPHLYGVTFCDSLHGLIVGEYGIVLGTEDRGKSWHMLAGGGMADAQLFTVTSVGGGKVVTAGQGGQILFSDDCGSHWVTSLPRSGLDIYNIVALDSKGELFAIGDLGNACLSVDAGRPESWHPVNLARGRAAALADTWLAAAVSGRDDILGFGQLGIWRLALDSTDKAGELRTRNIAKQRTISGYGRLR